METDGHYPDNRTKLAETNGRTDELTKGLTGTGTGTGTDSD